jgi:phospholipase D1/2
MSRPSQRNDDDLAYGDYHGQGDHEIEDRGFIGDIFHRIKSSTDSGQGSNQVCHVRVLFGPCIY